MAGHSCLHFEWNTCPVNPRATLTRTYVVTSLPPTLLLPAVLASEAREVQLSAAAALAGGLVLHPGASGEVLAAVVDMYSPGEGGSRGKGGAMRWKRQRFGPTELVGLL